MFKPLIHEIDDSNAPRLPSKTANMLVHGVPLSFVLWGVIIAIVYYSL